MTTRRQIVTRTLLPVSLLFSLIWGFTELAENVGAGSTHDVDEAIVRMMRTSDLSDPIGPLWLEEAARDVTALGGQVVLGLLVVLVGAWLVLHRRPRTALFVVGSAGVGLVLIYLLKSSFDRPRPALIPHLQRVYTSSFPSGHSMGAALTFLTLAALVARFEANRREEVFLIGVAIFLSVLVGTSRVYLGLHYPTDVLGGWAMGTAWALVCWLLGGVLARRGWLDDPVRPPAATSVLHPQRSQSVADHTD